MPEECVRCVVMRVGFGTDLEVVETKIVELHRTNGDKAAQYHHGAADALAIVRELIDRDAPIDRIAIDIALARRVLPYLTMSAELVPMTLERFEDLVDVRTKITDAIEGR